MTNSVETVREKKLAFHNVVKNAVPQATLRLLVLKNGKSAKGVVTKTFRRKLILAAVIQDELIKYLLVMETFVWLHKKRCTH
jgi:hypothetical protein